MKYVITSKEEKYDDVVSVTDDPAGDVWDREPIYYVDGQMNAWDQKGNRYNFIAEKKPETGGRIVYVGDWGQKGPQLMQVASGETERLRTALIKFLITPPKKQRKGLFNRRIVNPGKLEFDLSTAPIDQLINMTEERIAEQK